MTHLSKGQTEPTPLLSSEEKTVVLAQPSKPLANSESTLNSTPTTPKPSKVILSVSEKSRDHALLMKASLFQLRKAGLVKLFKVLSEDGKQTLEIQVVFDPSIWTENLELIVLSETPNGVVDEK